MFHIKYNREGKPTIAGAVTSITQADHITLEGRVSLGVIKQCAPPEANAYHTAYNPRDGAGRTTITYYLATVPPEIFERRFREQRKATKPLRERLRRQLKVSAETLNIQFTV